jgi:hypothetical protein
LSSERKKERKRERERRIDETLVNLIKTKHPAKGGQRERTQDQDQAFVNLIKTKHPAKGGQRERTQDQDQAKSAQTQRGITRGQRNKLCFRIATQLQEVYHGKKGKGNLKV